MKQFVIIIMVMLCITGLHAQPKTGINYQAAVHNSAGVLVINQSVGLRFNILKSGSLVYAETFTTTTNAEGLFNVVIGNGTPESGTYSSIDWTAATGNTLQVEVDVTGGTNYITLGTFPFVSVPYALYANKTAPIGDDGIVDVLRYVTITAGSFSTPSNSNINLSVLGIDMKNTFQAFAYTVVPIPSDWDGVSDFTFYLYFVPDGTSTGNVNFQIRANGISTGTNSNVGVSAVSSLNGTPVAVNSSQGTLYMQSFTVSHTAFTGKQVLQLEIARGGTSETYTDQVTFMMMKVGYTAKR